jgi:glycosyltransferase involved in cell wall biosynthesis
VKAASPLVSVIIPTYYRNERLKTAIESVLHTKYDSLEVIVVDDSGEGNARPVVEQYDNLCYVSLDKNRGQNAALNRGLKEISGTYVQFLDDDDEVFPGKFPKQVSLLESSPDTGVAYCGVKNDDGEINLPSADGRGSVLEDVLTFSLAPAITSTMLLDRSSLEDITPLPTPPGSTDTYMKIELAQVTEFDFVDEALVQKRDSADSVGASKAAIEGHRMIFEKYRDVYDQFDESIRKRALARFFNRAGRFYVSEHLWSPRAISAFGNAIYHSPEISIPYLGRFVGSLFGRPGVTIVERGMQRNYSTFGLSALSKGRT